MGTKKGQVRKTARRAYEPKKSPVTEWSRSPLRAFKGRLWLGSYMVRNRKVKSGWTPIQSELGFMTKK